MFDIKSDQYVLTIACIGTAVASLATGPTLILLFGIYELSSRPSEFLDWHIRGLLRIMGYSALLGLIASIPAATLNALVLHQLSRRRADHALIAAISGTLIGLLVTVVFAYKAPGGNIDGVIALLFSAAGLLMGLLHWVIAIRPLRRQRLRQMRKNEAME